MSEVKRALKLSTKGEYIRSGQRDDKSTLKRAWFCSRFAPFQGRFVVRRLGLATINLYIKYEVSMFTHYEDMKGENWGGLGG